NQFSQIADQVKENKIDHHKAMALAQLHYYEKKTSKAWKPNNVIEYKNGGYVPVNRPSAKKVEFMASKMTKEDAKAFRAFLDKYWGPEAA
ncbi:hypothetical protein ACTHQ2_23185, partial [Bacillus subtilis]